MLLIHNASFCFEVKKKRTKKFKNIWESTRDLDMEALDIIGEINSQKFDEYIFRHF